MVTDFHCSSPRSDSGRICETLEGVLDTWVSLYWHLNFLGLQHTACSHRSQDTGKATRQDVEKSHMPKREILQVKKEFRQVERMVGLKSCCIQNRLLISCGGRISERRAHMAKLGVWSAVEANSALNIGMLCCQESQRTSCTRRCSSTCLHFVLLLYTMGKAIWRTLYRRGNAMQPGVVFVFESL